MPPPLEPRDVAETVLTVKRRSQWSISRREKPIKGNKTLMIGKIMTYNQQKLNGLMSEAQTITAAYKSGTMTEAQNNRLKTINTEIDAQVKARNELTQSENLLNALNSGTESKGSGQVVGKRLTTEAVKSTAQNLARQLSNSETKAAITSGTFEAPLAGVEFHPTETPYLSRYLYGFLPLKPRPEAHYAYMRANTSQNNATTVAPGQKKPTSEFDYERIDDKLRTFAHLSDPVDELILGDFDALAEFIGLELCNGLMAAVDAQIIAGRGIDGESNRSEMVGLANMPGKLVVTPDTADAVPALHLIRKAKTALNSKGQNPLLVVLNPVEYENIELTQLTTGEYLTPGAPWSATTGQIWGMQTIQSPGVPLGQAYVIDPTALYLSTDTSGIRLAVSNQSGDDFEYNRVRFRAEGRWNVDVLRPFGIARVNFTQEAANA